MKVLLLADVECRALWDYFQPDRIADVDLIISCGDLRKEYLEFLVTMGRAPVFFVPGNHDGGYAKEPPEGCECIDGRLVTYRGLRILGLGGSIRYSGETYQYTEKEMAKRIWRLRWKVRMAHGVDLIVTHAPVAGCGDAPDPAHHGFQCFRDMLDVWHPAYLAHGHVHQNYGTGHPRLMRYGETTLINAYERYMLEI